MNIKNCCERSETLLVELLHEYLNDGKPFWGKVRLNHSEFIRFMSGELRVIPLKFQGKLGYGTFQY